MAINVSKAKEVYGNSDGKLVKQFKGGVHTWECFIDPEHNRNIVTELSKDGVPYFKVPVRLIADENGNKTTEMWNDEVFMFDPEGEVKEDNYEAFCLFAGVTGLFDLAAAEIGGEMDFRKEDFCQWLAIKTPGLKFKAKTVLVGKKGYTKEDGTVIEDGQYKKIKWLEMYSVGASSTTTDEPLPF